MAARAQGSGVALPVLGLLSVVGFTLAELYATSHASYDVWGGMLIGPILLAVSVPLARRAARKEADPRLAKLVVWALALKLLSSMVRYAVAFGLYGGAADSQAYSDRGAVLAQTYQLGIYVAPQGKLPGTGFIEILTGILYSVIGPTQVGAYLVFSWMGFWGLYLFYRAFCLAVPDGDRWRYARLVLLLPSLLYWPSSLGKEAWMMLCLGLAALGAARLFTGLRLGLLALLAGVAGAAMVRPHMALIVTAALVAGYLLRPSRRGSLFGPVGKGVMLAGLLLGGTLVLGQVETFFGTSTSDGESLTQVLDKTTAQTDQGGSQFTATRVRTPLDLPQATLNVLFRPFPQEAHNAQSLVSSAEGLFLLGLAATSWRRLKSLPRQLVRSPYLAFCTVYLTLFVAVFSSFANFGILTRQRVQVFPFFLALLCIPVVSTTRRYRDPTAAPGGHL